MDNLLKLSVLLVLITLTIGCSNSDSNKIVWRKLSPDAFLTQIDIEGSFIPSQLTLIKTSLKKYRIGVVLSDKYGSRTSSVQKLAVKSKASLGINANFFDEQNRPLGLVMSRGRVLNRIHSQGKTLTGILYTDRSNTVHIVQRNDFKPENALDAVQAGPRLIVNGKLAKGLRGSGKSSRRAGVCINDNGELVIFITSSLTGVTISQLAEALTHRQIGCQEALNLDGGGSAQLYVDSSISGELPIFLPGSDEIPVMLGLISSS